ncbi:hypothetical protein [uncultured Desulfobulbus sp.]|uniref:hypothetical protein n=1 Tax=uncultured Desulfobulbus sp. TaxID=239745 RepID=UPI0029C88201|nr:hypothetical protein [uncultured Desulfobulbus sp.]
MAEFPLVSLLGRKMKRQKIVFFTIGLYIILLIIAMFVSNFVPENSSTVYLLLGNILLSATIISYLEKRSDKRNLEMLIKRHSWAECSTLRRVFLFLASMFMLYYPVYFGIPWVYNTFFGENRYVFAIVTGWKGAGARTCAQPLINNLSIFHYAPHALCVSENEKENFKIGTKIKLVGKISKVGMNVSNIERQLP